MIGEYEGRPELVDRAVNGVSLLAWAFGVFEVRDPPRQFWQTQHVELSQCPRKFLSQISQRSAIGRKACAEGSLFTTFFVGLFGDVSRGVLASVPDPSPRGQDPILA